MWTSPTICVIEHVMPSRVQRTTYKLDENKGKPTHEHGTELEASSAVYERNKDGTFDVTLEHLLKLALQVWHEDWLNKCLMAPGVQCMIH